MTLIQATTLQVGAHGVMLLGASGAGKSDLALRLIADGALLVSDDQTRLTLKDGKLIANAPTTIAGKLEVRGLGIVRAAQIESAVVRLTVELAAPVIERMPEPAMWSPPHVAGWPQVPLIALAPFEPSALIKLRLALLAVLRA